MPVDPKLLEAMIGPQPTPGTAQPEEPGFMQNWFGRGTLAGTASESLGRTSNLVRSALVGEPGGGLRGLPGGVAGVADVLSLNQLRRLTGEGAQEWTDKLFGFGPENRISGQEMWKRAGVMETADNPLWSWQGALGLASELGTDPLMYTKLGTLTRAGEAAQGAEKTAKYTTNLTQDLARATARGDTIGAENARRLLSQAPPVRPIITPLAPTRAAQTLAGQRALVNFTPFGKYGPEITEKTFGLSRPAARVVGGVGRGADWLKGIAGRGPITEVGAETEHVLQAGENSLAKERALHDRLLVEADPVARREISQELANRQYTFNPSAGREAAAVYGRAVEQLYPAGLSPAAKQAIDKTLLDAAENGVDATGPALEVVKGITSRMEGLKSIEQRM